MTVDSIVMKIYEYDEASDSLIVAYKASTSGANIDDMQKVAYQPTMFQETDPEVVIKKIAAAGVSIVEMQERSSALKQNETAINFYKNLSGSQATYLVSELTAPSESPVAQ